MNLHDLGRAVLSALWALGKWLWPFGVWLAHPGNFLIFVSILLAATQWAYTVWKWRREMKRKGAN